MNNKMSNTTGLCAALFSLLGMVNSAMAADVNQQIETFCAGQDYNLQQTVKIGDVVAIANHRDGYLQINQTVDNEQVKQALLRLAQLSATDLDCMEYLNSRNLITTKADKALLARVYFNFDSSELTPESKTILDKIVQQLKQQPQVITLAGHTDAQGRKAYNQVLGLQRAEQSATYMTQQQLEPTQIKTQSYGELQPIDTNSTAQGRQQNRRVDINL
ncbi:OmpA family protein [Shewanella marina]|uniref:OmpA family protein n=1 Tax=Shewanella marina TaxID=487319 RepID=UPI00046F8459|nr:OmpA family protein [Shewanella marina]